MDNILKIINTIPFKITIDEWYLRYSITMIQNQIKVYHSSSFINPIPQIDDAEKTPCRSRNRWRPPPHPSSPQGVNDFFDLRWIFFDVLFHYKNCMSIEYNSNIQYIYIAKYRYTHFIIL